MLHVNQLVGFGAGGSDPIVFVGGNTATRLAATGSYTMSLTSGLTGGISSSASSGDFVIAAMTVASRSANNIDPITDGTNNYTDFTGSPFEVADSGGVYSALRVMYKFITSDTTVTFPNFPGTGGSGVSALYVFRNVNTSTPSDVTPTTATLASSVLANPPSITPVTSGSYIVCVGGGNHLGGVDTYSSSDLTDFLSAGADSSQDASLGIGHKPDWVSGAFDAAAFTFTQADDVGDSSTAMSIALRPM